MQYRTLGGTGIQVSTYALGTLMLGGMGNPDVDDSVRIIHKALDSGINLVDTADRYSRGVSEEVLGKALKGRRDEVVLATNFHGEMSDTDPNMRGASRRWIMSAVEGSLKRLGTDHLDLYQVHRPDPGTDIEETLSALSDLVRSGKVRAIGTSTFTPSQLVQAQWASERRGLERFRTEQPPYSILNRSIEAEVLPLCQEYGVGTLVYSPLSGGMLTGRVRKGQESDSVRKGFGMPMFDDERRLDAVEALIALADEAGMKVAHMAMAFAIAHPGVTSALIGPRTMEHLDDLLEGVGTSLSDDLLDRIDEIVPPGTDVSRLHSAWTPPALERPALRRRPVAERTAA